MAPVLAVDDPTLEKARQGETAALEALFRSLETPVLHLARHLVRDESEAEEVLQETFLEVVRSLGRYRGEAPLWAWVRRIAETKALMRLRGRRRHPEEPWDEEGPGPQAHPSLHLIPERLDLEAALAHLPPATRAVLWLHDVEGHTHEEIAELAGMTASFSKSQLSRAHARLRALLGAGQEEAEPCTRRSTN